MTELELLENDWERFHPTQIKRKSTYILKGYRKTQQDNDNNQNYERNRVSN